MRPAATTSPFQSLSKQEQREKWHAWQSTHLEVRDLDDAETFQSPPFNPQNASSKATPPLKPIPQTPFIPRHSEYDKVMSRMKQAANSMRFID